MLTSVYYSEKRDKICLVTLNELGKLFVRINPDNSTEERNGEIDVETLFKRFLDNEYQIIGYYNEDI